MTPQETYKTLENDCFNPLTVDPNPLHDNYRFSLILRLENTRWGVVQREFMPELRSEIGPLSSKLEKVIHTLEWVRIEAFVEWPWP